MITKIAVLAMIPFAMTMGMFLTTDTMFVDVKEGGEDGIHLFVPVPMFLASAAMRFVPEEETTLECEELWRYRHAISRVVDELRDAPDGELVRVEERNTLVTITKDGNNLLVHVLEDDTEVKAKLPLNAAHRFLARLEGPTFSVKDLLGATNNTMFGEVVHVTEGDTEVRVWVF